MSTQTPRKQESAAGGFHLSRFFYEVQKLIDSLKTLSQRHSLYYSQTGESHKNIEGIAGLFTERYYTCTPQMLKGLGEGYAGGGKSGGEFAHRAIKIYCAK